MLKFLDFFILKQKYSAYVNSSGKIQIFARLLLLHSFKHQAIKNTVVHGFHPISQFSRAYLS